MKKLAYVLCIIIVGILVYFLIQKNKKGKVKTYEI